MRKLLLPLVLVSGVSFAASLDMNNLYCSSLKITSATTLKEVQDNCKIKKQGLKDAGYMLGLYQVTFINTATKKSVICDFGRNDPTEKVSGCR